MTSTLRWPSIAVLALTAAMLGGDAALAQTGGKGPVIGMPGGGCDTDFAARRDGAAAVDPRGGCDGFMSRDASPDATRGARPATRPAPRDDTAPAKSLPRQERDRGR